uniref:Uncharacterized protein n=1 Tax=Heterorhabditis bacteriophora TaxID=37862 RepID=A0A1I7WW81_HETBA
MKTYCRNKNKHKRNQFINCKL